MIRSIVLSIKLFYGCDMRWDFHLVYQEEFWWFVLVYLLSLILSNNKIYLNICLAQLFVQLYVHFLSTTITKKAALNPYYKNRLLDSKMRGVQQEKKSFGKPLEGFEPSTYSLPRNRATRLCYSGRNVFPWINNGLFYFLQKWVKGERFWKRKILAKQGDTYKIHWLTWCPVTTCTITI